MRCYLHFADYVSFYDVFMGKLIKTIVIIPLKQALKYHFSNTHNYLLS